MKLWIHSFARSLLVLLTTIMLPIVATAQSSSTSPVDVTIDGRRLAVDGRPFLVKGIHYGPWRPGSGPTKDYEYPDLAGVARDFDAIRDANANTVFIYEAPREVLDLAFERGLKVIYCFPLWWPEVGSPGQAAITARVVQRVEKLKSHPALLAWILGNEVSGMVRQERGDAPIVEGLRDMYAAIKRVDPAHPVSHANWPPARGLDLAFLDFVSFNVYPLWPPEVVALGFGPYIETVLQPIAGNRPLLISEFGVNTIEAGEQGQARLLQTSWQELLAAGAAGGVVFEFADEWWKNYDNPSRPGDWWTRVHAPDDELTFDNDPEETYGIVTAERTPKLALTVVADMFGAEDTRTTARTFGLVGLLSIVLTSTGGWVWARRHHRQRQTTTSRR